MITKWVKLTKKEEEEFDRAMNPFSEKRKTQKPSKEVKKEMESLLEF